MNGFIRLKRARCANECVVRVHDIAALCENSDVGEKDVEVVLDTGNSVMVDAPLEEVIRKMEAAFAALRESYPCRGEDLT